MKYRNVAQQQRQAQLAKMHVQRYQEHQEHQEHRSILNLVYVKITFCINFFVKYLLIFKLIFKSQLLHVQFVYLQFITTDQLAGSGVKAPTRISPPESDSKCL